ncbi:hypothetical protein [Glycomyces buryatensis]|uniref:Uncharacterized protein n=1 Tax=Glycomyces buryatensis TaxID=2570927 RepID=A0A4V6T6N7_9ACTN|nr:hypothetical protein [Glycomyces buryatensis]THV39606.1 hypothetical protein FAB82_17195 [Glycomyces buryatensis]
MVSAIPTKPTFSAGERVSAAKMNTLSNHADWVTDAPMIHLYLGSNTVLNTSGFVTWNNLLTSLSNFSVTLPATYITVPYTGIWEWKYQLSLSHSPASSNPASATLYVGDASSQGTRVAGDQMVRVGGGMTTFLACSAYVAMTAGTTAIRCFWQSSTTGMTAYGTSRATCLSGRLLQRL